MLMMRSDILLLSDEEVLASLDAYKKRKISMMVII